MLNFYELDKLLIDASAGSRAAECHGFLCGFLCVNNNPQDDVFGKYLFTEISTETTAEPYRLKIVEFAADVRKEITAPDFKLQLLLPDDEKPIQERSLALMEWCQGFLNGLGSAGIMDFSTMSTESRELIDDLYKICRIETEGLDEADEEQESALFELIEYVRMGALLLYEEFQHRPVVMVHPEILH